MQNEATGNESILIVWWHYLRSGSSIAQLFYLASIVIISQATITRTDFYLIYWTHREELRQNGVLENETMEVDLVIFGVLLLFVTVVSIQKPYTLLQLNANYLFLSIDSVCA